MRPIIIINLSRRRPWHWVITAVLTAFLTVQALPYLALAAVTPPVRPGQAAILRYLMANC